MAYATVASFEKTIERLLNSSCISIVQNSSPQIVKLLYMEVRSLREALGEFNTRKSTINMKMVKSLEAEIIDVVYQIEDVIDPHLSNQLHSQSEVDASDHPQLMVFSVDVQEIKQDVDSFIETVNIMKMAYIHELHNPSPEEEEEDDCVISSTNESCNMVGLSHLFMAIKDHVGENSSKSEQMIVSLIGMAGIGKTTLAKKLFQDPFIVSRYSTRVFVTIGPKYLLADILVDILTQLNAPDVDEIIMLMKGEELLDKLKEMVYESLMYLRYLIVLDDVWYIETWDSLINLFPYNNNGSQVLQTTRLHEVGEYAMRTFIIPFLDEKESWDLLREKVFGEQESFSYKLEKAGKEIAENCEGLPLTIVTVANILSKADKTIEYWNEVAADKQHSVYKDAYDQMSEVLYPSYDYLDQHLKSCFLYLGAFPQNYLMRWGHLVNLWSAEGFPHSEPNLYSDQAILAFNGAYYYLIELCSQNVMMNEMETTSQHLHSSFWYLSNKEAAKTKFFYALNCRDDASRGEGITYEHRLCIRNNVLLAIKDVYDSVASTSRVRSLLCTGYFHEYPVPLCLEHLRLLRVLDALNIRLYEFPMEVVKLVQLRYLALTYNGNLPTSLSKLLNLQYLIVGRSIIKSDWCMLPIEIWNMRELKSLQAMGRDLPHPPCKGSLLPNLLELNGVSPRSCTKDVLEKIPNLEVLVITIILAHDASEPLSCFDHISHLNKLKVLQCYITNPTLKAEVVSPLAPLSNLPSSLTSLTLSGLGYPWEEMRKISSLPNLTHLELKSYAFRGPKWEVHDKEFRNLMSLWIEDTDLVHWKFTTTNLCLPAIEFISLKHCYKLKRIPMKLGTSQIKYEIADCYSLVLNGMNHVDYSL